MKEILNKHFLKIFSFFIEIEKGEEKYNFKIKNKN